MATIKQVKKHILECMKECVDGEKMSKFADAMMTLHDIEYYQKYGRFPYAISSNVPGDKAEDTGSDS